MANQGIDVMARIEKSKSGAKENALGQNEIERLQDVKNSQDDQGFQLPEKMPQKQVKCVQGAFLDPACPPESIGREKPGG